MSIFMLAYYGGNKPKSPDLCQGHMLQWEDWEETIGDDLIDPGTPLGNHKAINATGVKSNGITNPLAGFSILEASDIDSALEKVKNNPHLKVGGTIEVSELLEKCG